MVMTEADTNPVMADSMEPRASVATSKPPGCLRNKGPRAMRVWSAMPGGDRISAIGTNVTSRTTAARKASEPLYDAGTFPWVDWKAAAWLASTLAVDLLDIGDLVQRGTTADDYDFGEITGVIDGKVHVRWEVSRKGAWADLRTLEKCQSVAFGREKYNGMV